MTADRWDEIRERYERERPSWVDGPCFVSMISDDVEWLLARVAELEAENEKLRDLAAEERRLRYAGFRVSAVQRQDKS